MNLSFVDVNKSFLNMVHQDTPRDVLSNTSNTVSKRPLFSEELNETLEKIEQYGNELSSQVKKRQDKGRKLNQIRKGDDSDKTIEQLSEDLNQKEGLDFVLALKNIFLMMSNGDLKNISIDSDGLEALKKMLLKAGFKESEVNDLMDSLSKELENKTLSLDDFLDDLFLLFPEAKTDTDPLQENFFQTAAIPFLESIFNSLGISKEKIDEILFEADKGDKGISLETIIEKLQNLQKESFYSGIHYKSKEGDDSFDMLTKQLGLDQKESRASALTLDEFVSSLEKLHQNLSRQQVDTEPQPVNNLKQGGDEKFSDLFNTLFKGLDVKDKNPEIQAFNFSYNQIKDQLQNQFILPGDEKMDKKGLFLLEKNNEQYIADTKIKNIFKEMESLLNGKKDGMTDSADPSRVTRDLLKHIKSDTAKLLDQTQMSSLDAKTNGTQSGLSLLKTKSSFRNLPTYVTHQVTKSLVRAINQGENTLRIQLKPPELGRLMMTIDNTGNSMKVSIMTENIAAKEIIASNVNELRTLLSNSGVNLERFEVDMNSNFQQSMADAGNQAGGFKKQRQNRGEFDRTNGEGIKEPKGLLNLLNQDGALHYVA